MELLSVESWVYSTKLIENEWGKGGTGFLVSREVPGVGLKGLLVTNKHVLHEDPAKRAAAKRLRLHFSVKGEDGIVSRQSADYTLLYRAGSKCWHAHEDPDVDVLVVDVSGLFEAYPEIEARRVDFDSCIAHEGTLDNLDISVGDDLLVIGYP